MEWLNITLLCERLKCLPEPGGLFDQRPSTLDYMGWTFEALDEYREDKRKQEEVEAERASKRP